MKKPKVNLEGVSENIFHVMAVVCRALRDNGMKDKPKELFSKVQKCKSFEAAMEKIKEYVEF